MTPGCTPSATSPQAGHNQPRGNKTYKEKKAQLAQSNLELNHAIVSRKPYPERTGHADAKKAGSCNPAL